MARSCGIHLGTRRFEIVVLDGGPKKQTLVAAAAGDLDPNAANPGQALKEALAKHKVSKENVGLVIDAGSAAFRRLTLPLTDASKIEQVLKFEVEKDLPQWDIDEVVADHLVMASNDMSSDLLVTAVPKEQLSAALTTCEWAGAEPYEVELETTAMVNAALYSDLCPIDTAQALVHVGEHSTAVVIMDGGQVNEMRVVHLGALGTEAPEGLAGDSAEGEVTEEKAELPSQQEREHNSREALRRIRRELGRSISAARTRNDIEAIYVCGLDLPDLVGDSVMDIPIEEMNAFGPEGSTLRQNLPAEERGRWVVAFGAALRELGAAKLSPKLRRENLTYAGTWERVEFPLAVCSLLLATLLAVMFILQQKELKNLNVYGAGHWATWSNAYMMGNPKMGERGKLSPPPGDIRSFLQKLEAGEGGSDGKPFSDDYFAATKRIDALLRTEVANLKKELGADTSIEQPQSALVGAHLVLDLLEGHQKDWRPSIRHFDAVTQGMGKSSGSESVRVTVTLVLLADSVQAAASNYEALLNELKLQPWHINSTRSNVVSLENDKGLLIERLPVEVDVSVYYEQQRRDALEAAQ